jgi:hypothetical protein
VVRRHHGTVTNEHETRPASLPADPEAYDSPRARIARAKGLEAPYIAGGLDPDPETGLAEERKYGKWLIWMVAGLMFGGFIIGIAIAITVGTVP